MALVLVSATACAQPERGCDRPSGTVQRMVCTDPALARQDERLEALYEQTKRRDREWKRWRAERDTCARNPDVRECVAGIYVEEIARVQATAGLVARRGPVHYRCEGGDEKKTAHVSASFFGTEPPSALFTRGNRTEFALRAPSEGDTLYGGTHVVFWMKGQEGRMTWELEEMRCQVVESGR